MSRKSMVFAGLLVLGAGIAGIIIGKSGSLDEPAMTGDETTVTEPENRPARHAEGARSVPDLVKRAFRSEVTVPAGSRIRASLETTLASHESRIGDSFTLQVIEPVVAEGRVAIPAGATVRGVVTGARPSGKISGRGEISLDFKSVTDVKGDAHALDVDGFYGQARSVTDRDAAMIAGGAGTGAIIGGIVGGKKGALIGGVIGGAAGTGTVLATKGPEVRLAAGTVMVITLNTSLRMPAGEALSS